MDGLIVVDKPLHLSSMDVVRHVRRAVRAGLVQQNPDFRGKVKCGHAGTLDPLATGVVVCGIGKATKRMDVVMGQTKVYEAGIDLSAFTATDDAEAPPEPPQGMDEEHPPKREDVERACQGFVGDIKQVPPIYSAVHVNGQRAYALARKGQDVKLEPRAVHIDAIEVLGYEWPAARLRVTCGKGVYIRSLARDLGRALGTGGFLTSLRRTAVGGFTLERAHPIERFEEAIMQDDLIPLDG